MGPALPALFWLVLIASLGIGLALAGLRCGRERQSALRARDLAREEAAKAIHLLQLAASDLRVPALKLLGHLDCLRRPLPPGAPGFDAGLNPLDGIAGHLLSLADDLQDHGTPSAPRVIDAECLPLGPLLDDAVEAVAAGIAPGRRRWKVQETIGSLVLDVDRRAMREVLVRVLSNAVRLSRDGDEIDISLDRQGDWLRLIVADEGHGQLQGEDAATMAGRAPPFRTRGVGLGLALARSLMEAMEGRLGFETVLNVGTRVTLEWPSERVLSEPSSPRPPALRMDLLANGAFR